MSDSLYLWLEVLSVAFALAYLGFAIRESLWCWPAALISVALWAVVVLDARLYMDFGLQIFYFVMGIYGWYQWRMGGASHAGVRVHWWSWRAHLLALGLALLAAAAFTRVLAGTDAAFPFLDSLTTVAAILATFMVARKVMENWIYWFVIDSIYIYLYVQRELFWYAALYGIYLVMIVFGYRAWLRSLRSREAAAGADAQAGAGDGLAA